MNRFNLNDFELWIFASQIAMHANEFFPEDYNLDTSFVTNTKSLRKLSRSRDVIAQIITEFTSLIGRRPSCPDLYNYLKAILRKDLKLYIEKEEVARIWDIPINELYIENLAELESINIYGRQSYLWEDLVDLFR